MMIIDITLLCLLLGAGAAIIWMTHKSEAMRLELNRTKHRVEDLEYFIYTASHDLKGSVSSISTYASLLKKNHKNMRDEELDKYVEFIRNDAEIVKENLRGILNYMISLKENRVEEDMNVSEILTEAARKAGLRIEENNARVINDVEEDLKCRGNREDIVWIIHQLIDNAIKHRSERKPEITITAAKKGDKVIIGVKDNGKGFDPGFSEKIFQMFEKLDSRVITDGSGMGLAICRKLAERNSGDISVHSKEKIGSEFYLTLPAAV